MEVEQLKWSPEIKKKTFLVIFWEEMEKFQAFFNEFLA